MQALTRSASDVESELPALDPNCTTNLGCETTELTRTGGTIGALLGRNW